jgi:hypothetical protein
MVEKIQVAVNNYYGQYEEAMAGSPEAVAAVTAAIELMPPGEVSEGPAEPAAEALPAGGEQSEAVATQEGSQMPEAAVSEGEPAHSGASAPEDVLKQRENGSGDGESDTIKNAE